MPASSSFSASEASPLAGETTPGAQSPVTPDNPGEVPVWRSGVILLLTMLVGLVYWFNPPLSIEPKAGVGMDLPVLVGNYLSRPGKVSQIELSILPKDTEFARRYYDDGEGHQIECSIVLSGAEQRSIHRPEACLTGQGWSIVGQDNIPIPLPSGHKLMARKLTLEREVIGLNGEHVVLRAFYVYWFVGQNVSTYSEMWRVLLSNWDRVVHNRAHRWAYVSIFSYITDDLRPDGLDPAQTQALLVDFAGQIVPTFQISEMPSQAKN
jgi:EpsI family protein